MASFFENLWESIFTPGPTPTLLIATNATFACLQLVLFLLLIATYSIHFVILSFLCGGLWWAINWFAVELRAAQIKEAEEKAKAETAAQQTTDYNSDTETESTAGKQNPPASAAASSSLAVPVDRAQDLKHRAESSKSAVSTEDEWEKVSEGETEKDK